MVIFAAVLMAFAWALFAGFCWVFYQAIRSYRWPAVKAELLDYGVEENRDDEGRSWYVDAQYRYQVNGQTYTGDNLRFVRCSSFVRLRSLQDLKRLRAIRRSPEGFHIHYDPMNPKRSVVFNGLDGRMLFVMCFMLMMTSIFTAMFFLAWLGVFDTTSS